MRWKIVVGAFILLMITAQVDAQVSTGELILFPLGPQTATEGAFGSRWEVRHEWRNTDDEPICYSVGLFGGIPEPTCLEAGASQSLAFGAATPWWVYFYGRVENMQFNITARDTSRETHTWGAEIPVARLSRFREENLELLGIPTAPAFRRHLRLYALAENITLAVRVWDSVANATAPLDEKTYHFTLHNNHATVAFEQEFPTVFRTSRVRLQIERIAGSGRFWAFISVTNNDTQHITTISPQ